MRNKNQNLMGNLPVPSEFIERRIYLIRGIKVMLDSDLAELYQVETKALTRSVVKRNPDRFPPDFMFQLTQQEFDNLKCQIGTSSSGYGGRRYLPYAFTELGVAMLSSVLSSERAVRMNILIMRAFVKLREFLASNKEISRKIGLLENTQKRIARTQQQHTAVLVGVVQDIQKLKSPLNTNAIGFAFRPNKRLKK